MGTSPNYRFENSNRYPNSATGIDRLILSLPRFYSGATNYNVYWSGTVTKFQHIKAYSICIGKIQNSVYFAGIESNISIYIDSYAYAKYNKITDADAISNILDLLPTSWLSYIYNFIPKRMLILYQYNHDDLVADGIGYNR